MDTVVSALSARLRSNPGAPLVTYVDQARGERTELSATTLANAASKIANALRDEYDLDPGALVSLLLPLHWQLSAWLLGAWTAGVIVTIDPHEDSDLVVTTADHARTLDQEVGVVSLHPFGLPISEDLPARAHDVTLSVRQQPDAYLFEPPQASAVALRQQGRDLTSMQVWQRAAELAAAWNVAAGGRVLVEAADLTPDLVLAAAAVPLAVDGSVVIATGVVDMAALCTTERVTTTASLG